MEIPAHRGKVPFTLVYVTSRTVMIAGMRSFTRGYTHRAVEILCTNAEYFTLPPKLIKGQVGFDRINLLDSSSPKSTTVTTLLPKSNNEVMYFGNVDFAPHQLVNAEGKAI